jgi:rare lipoprotein A
MINNLQCEFRVFRHGQTRSTRLGFSTISLLGFMLLTTGVAHAYREKESESRKPWHKQATAAQNRDVIVGKASWYGQAAAGRKTATGERLDPNKLTAASTQLPLQSRALVTDLENGRSVCVRINDCGPYAKGRKLDVSKRAAEELDMAHSGTAPVKIALIATPPNAVYCPRPAPTRRRNHSHFHRTIGVLTNPSSRPHANHRLGN